MAATRHPPAGPLILLVEDDTSVREALTFALRVEGYELEVFGDAESLLERGPPPTAACIILDQNLPGCTGTEGLHLLRERGVDCPAILITTQPRPEVLKAAAKLGARLLEKPLLGDALPAALREILAG